jgi:hypothetical protein
VTVAVAILGVFAVEFAVFLTPLGQLGVVLVGVQATLQLLGPALLLGSGVAFFLLLVERLELALQGVVAGPGLLAGL